MAIPAKKEQLKIVRASDYDPKASSNLYFVMIGNTVIAFIRGGRLDISNEYLNRVSEIRKLQPSISVFGQLI